MIALLFEFIVGMRFNQSSQQFVSVQPLFHFYSSDCPRVLLPVIHICQNLSDDVTNSFSA